MSKYIRPNWLEYFMGIVDAVAKKEVEVGQ